MTHARLTADTATHMPVGFRSWRDTGITWLALSNVDVGKMQRRAGHDTLAFRSARRWARGVARRP